MINVGIDWADEHHDVCIVDETGKYLDHATIYPHAPKNQWDQSIHTLAARLKIPVL